MLVQLSHEDLTAMGRGATVRARSAAGWTVVLHGGDVPEHALHELRIRRRTVLRTSGEPLVLVAPWLA